MTDEYDVGDEFEMAEEYDFSKGERGKYCGKKLVFLVPVWLDLEVVTYFTTRAKEMGVETEALLNDILRCQRDVAAAREQR